MPASLLPRYPEFRLLVVALLATATGSCGGGGGDTTGPGPEAVASVELSPGALSLTIGQTSQLAATPRAADGSALTGRTITWATADPATATVIAGLVTAVAPGQTEVTATSEGKAGSTSVTVSALAVPVASVTVTPSAANIAQGATVQLIAIAKDANGATLVGRAVAWTTSAASVAEASATGLVTGKGVGSATVTATIEGKQGSAQVTVTAAAGMVRTWVGGASGKATDWSTAGNWNPAGSPIPADTVRIPAVANSAVLSEDAQVARMIVAGGRASTAGHRLVVKAQN